jgi:hypothetical protein
MLPYSIYVGIYVAGLTTRYLDTAYYLLLSILTYNALARCWYESAVSSKLLKGQYTFILLTAYCLLLARISKFAKLH